MSFNLTKGFNFVSELEQLDYNNDVNILMGGDGISNRRSLQAILKNERITLKKKKDKDFIDFLLMESIRRTLKQVDVFIEQQHRRMTELLDQIQQTQNKLDGLNEKHGLIEEQLKFYQENGCFDLDENGKFKNQKIEDILTAYERDHNLVIDRNDYGAMFEILMDIEDGRLALRDSIKQDTEEYERHEAQVEQAQQLKDDLQSGDPERMQAAMAGVQNLEHRSKSNPISITPKVHSADKDLLNELPDTVGSGFSFGFPPLRDNFSDATNNQPPTPAPEPNQKQNLKNDVSLPKPR